jgi:hypothetical protein
LAFTCTNCTACGFCTPAAGGERRPKLTRARRSRKTATVVIETLGIERLGIETLGIETLGIESLAAESLAVEIWGKDILQRGNLFLLCTSGNLGCQLRRAKQAAGCRTWA